MSATWDRRTFPQAVFVDLLAARPRHELMADPQRLQNYFPAGYEGWVVLDEILDTYVQTYLQQEVAEEGPTRNMPAFSRFLEAAALSAGAPLNVSAVARECQVDRKTTEDYFSILEDLLIAYRLPVFSKRAKRRLLSQRKCLFFDTGVYRSIRPRGPLDDAESIDGIALETLVEQHVRAYNAYLNTRYGLIGTRTTTSTVASGSRSMISQMRSLGAFRWARWVGQQWPAWRGEPNLLCLMQALPQRPCLRANAASKRSANR